MMTERNGGIRLHPWYRRHFPRGLLRRLSRSGFEIRLQRVKSFFLSKPVWMIVPKRQRSFKRAQRLIGAEGLSSDAPRKKPLERVRKDPS